MRPRVLITRSRELASGLIQILDSTQLDLICVPVTKTRFVVQTGESPDLSTFNWIAFTSANGVRGFAEVLKASKQIIPSLCRVACLGEATAAVARRALLSDVDFIGTHAHGSGFAESLVEHVRGTRPLKILYPCAREALPDFPDTCRAHGLEVTNFSVYETVAIPTAQVEAQLQNITSWNVAVFYAPSAVNAFATAWPAAHDYEVVAIGATTASALSELHFARIWTCESPTPINLATAINDALAFQQEQRLETLQNETAADLATERLD